MGITVIETAQKFRSSLETIEKSYEFMLAYAAQGRATDEDQKVGPSIRQTLEELLASLGVIADQVSDALANKTNSGFTDALRDDAIRAAHSVRLALSCERISSQLIDNLNASIHLRAVLTGLFLADEAVTISSA